MSTDGRDQPTPPPEDADAGPGRTFMELSSVQFAQLARMITHAARKLGDNHTNVNYRSPPREPGVTRSIRGNQAEREWTVSVTIRGRNAHAVVADMIDGYCAAADRAGIDARTVLFDGLWEAVDEWLCAMLDRESAQMRKGS